jgi:hypothetical protein
LASYSDLHRGGAPVCFRLLRRVAPALVAAALCGCSGPSVEVLGRPTSGNVAREGPVLVLHGEPYRSASYVAFQLTGCGPNTEVFGGDRVDTFFAGLRPRSLVRTYAFEPLGVDRLDAVVRSAEEHGHYLTLVLSDHSSSCGEGEVDKTPAFYETGFRDAYLSWVQEVVARYRDSSAVAMWEPMKAVRDIDARTLRNFYDVIGGEIHRLAPDHLVEAGMHAPWAYGGADGYRLVAESAGIDVATFIAYDADADEMAGAIEITRAALAGIDKPLVLPEMGVFASRDGDPGVTTSSNYPCVGFQTRSDRVGAALRTAFADGVAAVHVWNYTAAPNGACSYDVGPGDPLEAMVRAFELP